jgi:hypothetical protein
MLLGHPTYLKAKVVREKSMLEKWESLEDAESYVLQDPCDIGEIRTLNLKDLIARAIP